MTAGYTPILKFAFRYASYFAAAWVAVFWSRWQKRRRENIAQAWPFVEGVILSGTVERIRKTSHYNATLQYSYFVEEYRTGTYVHEFAKEPEADEFVRQLKDKRVQIRYKQSNPNKSVLEQRVVEQIVLLAPRHM
jgi:hypothetical protein